MHFDASGIIHAWDEYPKENFPLFWEWIEVQVSDGTSRICEEAFKEVEHKYPECAKWLKERGIARIPLNDDILTQAKPNKGIT